MLNPSADRVLDTVRALLREKGPQPGADIGNALRREIPDYSPRTLGVASLSSLLETAEDMVIVGRNGNDRIWALGESVSDRDIEHALGSSTEPEGEQPGALSTPVTGVDLINFRSCQNVTLNLDELTVLVGPNGSGKSTLLHGISYASQATRGKLRAVFSGPRDVHRLRTDGQTDPMELAIRAGDKIELRVVAEPLEEDTKFTVSLKSGKKKVESWTSPGEPPSPPLPSRAESRLFWPSVLLKFRAEALSAPSDVEDGEPRLNFDGSGLPTVLATLALTDPARKQAIIDRVRRVVPAVLDMRHPTVRRSDVRRADERGERDATVFQYRLEVRMKGAGWVPADLLSEGTLFAFGVHAVLTQRIVPRIVLMDDIDRGLHPRAQRALIQQMKEVCREGGPRIVLSTHSPYILDELPPESVRVVRAVDGKTRVRALVEHPEWQEWKESMTSGEFWTYVGEDWLEEAA